jgi:hypothetical protein
MRPIGAKKPLVIDTNIGRIGDADKNFVARWGYGKYF